MTLHYEQRHTPRCTTYQGQQRCVQHVIDALARLQMRGLVTTSAQASLFLTLAGRALDSRPPRPFLGAVTADTTIRELGATVGVRGGWREVTSADDLALSRAAGP
jgi:hypothetical protein